MLAWVAAPPSAASIPIPADVAPTGPYIRGDQRLGRETALGYSSRNMPASRVILAFDRRVEEAVSPRRARV